MDDTNLVCTNMQTLILFKGGIFLTINRNSKYQAYNEKLEVIGWHRSHYENLSKTEKEFGNFQADTNNMRNVLSSLVVGLTRRIKL